MSPLLGDAFFTSAISPTDSRRRFFSAARNPRGGGAAAAARSRRASPVSRRSSSTSRRFVSTIRSRYIFPERLRVRNEVIEFPGREAAVHHVRRQSDALRQ